MDYILHILILIVTLGAGLFWQSHVFRKDYSRLQELCSSESRISYGLQVFGIFIIDMIVVVISPLIFFIDCFELLARREPTLWQLFKNHFKRVYIPVIVGNIIFFAVLLHSSIALLIDSNSDLTGDDTALMLLNVWILIMTSAAKSWIGPIVSTILVLTGIYNWFEYGTIETWSLMQGFFSYIFYNMPAGAETGYKIFLATVIILFSIIDSFDIEL